MAQKNSVYVFIRKTSSDSRGRLNLRFDMNQGTNLKSLGFTWRKYYIYRESPKAFDPHISAIFRFVVDGVGKLLFVTAVVEADDSSAPTLWTSLLSSPLPPSLVLGNCLSIYCWTEGCWFSSISSFCQICQIYKSLHYLFWGILTIHDSVYERDAQITSHLCCLTWQICVACLPSI